MCSAIFLRYTTMDVNHNLTSHSAVAHLRIKDVSGFFQFFNGLVLTSMNFEKWLIGYRESM